MWLTCCISCERHGRNESLMVPKLISVVVQDCPFFPRNIENDAHSKYFCCFPDEMYVVILKCHDAQ